MTPFSRGAALVLLSFFLSCTGAIREDMTEWKGRSLESIFNAIEMGCPQGPPETVTEETMLNHHNWWEQHWGRTDASWPRRGFQDCWANRGSVCALPDRDHVVCLPGSRRGSTIAKGWALDPKGQACKPGVHCLYACEPGYYWTTYNQSETSNYDHANAHQRGHCDGTWNYGTSSHGVYCKEDGTLALPSQPLCQLGETYVYAENRLDTHIFLCQTVFPGHEIFLIPTLVRPGESVMITTQPVNFWHGPSYSKPTHGDFYVSFAGADIMEACTWDEFSPSGAALLPYEIGSGVEDNGVVYSTHYFYQQPNSELPSDLVGYQMDLECESSESGVCGPVFRSHNVVKADVLKKPRNSASTKVRFVFKPPQTKTEFGEMYRTPSRVHLQDVTWITGLKKIKTTSYSSQSFASHHTSKHQSSAEAHSVSYSSGSSSSSSSAVSTSHSSSASATSYAEAGGSHSQTSFVPDFTSNFAHGNNVQHGRRLKHESSRPAVYLHNTLEAPILLCRDETGGGASVGPGERIQLEQGALLKISTGESCVGAEFSWEMRTGQRHDDAVVYAYRQDRRVPGHNLSIRCVAEGEACTAQNAHSVVLSPSRGAEVTFTLKPTARPSGQSYAWGKSVLAFATSFFRSQ